MKKPLIAVLCAGLLLSGCRSQELPNFVEMDESDYPVISVSPTLEPLGQRVTQAALGCSEQDALKHILRADSSREAYRQFAEESAAQLLIAYETDLGDDIEWIPFGADALVFAVSPDCTVDGLSVQQLKDIYAGRITDWSEVGGAQQTIRIHHRAKGSASRSALELAMKVRAAEDSTKVREGSLYYMTYSEYLSVAEGSLKLLAVDGVVPSEKLSAKYEFHMPYGAAIRRDAARDSKERLLYEWLWDIADGSETSADVQQGGVKPKTVYLGEQFG